MTTRRLSKPIPAEWRGRPLVLVASTDVALLSALERLAVRVERIRLGEPLPLESADAGVLLIDTAFASPERLRELRSEPQLTHHVSVVLSGAESRLAEDQRMLGTDDAELRNLDTASLARRLHAWNELAMERYGNRLLNQALDASINGVCLADARTQGFPITYVSRTFQRMTGYTSAECIGRSCRFLQGPETSPDAVAAVREALSAGTQFTAVLLNYRKDGTTFWNELTVIPLRDERGVVETVMGVQHDVTQLMTARLLHRESEERAAFMAALLDDVDAMLTTDEDGLINFANRSAEQLLGRTLASLLGASLVGVLRLPPVAELALSSRNPTSLQLSYELIAAGGTLVAVEVALRASTSDRVSWIATVRRSADLEKRASEREQAARLVAVGSMLAGLAHEIRTPLATMSLLLGEVAESADSTTTVMVAKVRRQLDRVARIVRETSLFARPHRALRTAADAKLIAIETVEGLRSRIDETKIHVAIECDQILTVRVDERQVVQLLTAVVNNALDAARTRVVIRVGNDGRATTFAVIDDGVGIQTAHLPRVFDPFFTTKSTGTGLGLAIARRLAEEQGGSLTLSDTSAAGTTFTLSLAGEVEDS